MGSGRSERGCIRRQLHAGAAHPFGRRSLTKRHPDRHGNSLCRVTGLVGRLGRPLVCRGACSPGNRRLRFALWKDKTGQLFRKEAEGVAVNSARRDTALSVVATRCGPASVPCDPDVRRVTLGFAAACAIVTRRTPISRAVTRIAGLKSGSSRPRNPRGGSRDRCAAPSGRRCSANLDLPVCTATHT